MSHRRKPTEFEVEQSVLLGQKVSDKHEEFREWGMMDADEAFILWMMDNPGASMKDMLKTHAKLEFLKSTTEVTRLAMITGTDTVAINMREEVERLRKTVSGP